MNDAAAVASRPDIPYLPRRITEPHRPLRVIAITVAMSIAGALLLATLWSFVFPAAAPPRFDVGGWVLIFAVVIFAPVTETLIMAGILEILLRLARPAVAVGISALLWGAAHSALTPIWGLVIWWPFLLFSTLYVVWRQRSIGAALAMPAIAHALNNLGPTLVMLSGLGR